MVFSDVYLKTFNEENELSKGRHEQKETSWVVTAILWTKGDLQGPEWCYII